MRGTVCAACIVLLTAVAAAQDVPYLTGRVMDDAHILSDQARTSLTATLKAHEDATTNQIVVLTVPTIGGADPESYANNVFHTWKLGQKGKDNGVLVVVVPIDRKMRIEVGYGLEETLPDGAAGEIIRTWMTPAFKAGNYDKGVEDGVAAIVARLEGHAPTGLTPMRAAPRARSAIRPPMAFQRPPIPFPMNVLIGLFVFSILGLFTFVGVMTPGMGWFLYVFLIPFWSMFPMFIIGPQATLVLVATYLIGYPIVKLRLREQPWYQKAATELKTSGHTSIGGFAISGGGSGFSGGGDGGGFSGGGGDSGGGGASGSW